MEQVEEQRLPHPAERPFVTFDTNIIYATCDNEPAAQPAQQLLALSRAGIITINVTLSTALEQQRPDEKLQMHEYAAWLQELGITHGNIFSGRPFRCLDKRTPIFSTTMLCWDFISSYSSADGQSQYYSSARM